MIFKGNKKMRKTLLLLVYVLPVFTTASPHRLIYSETDLDRECLYKAGLRIDLRGVYMQDAVDRMEQKIIKSGKMNKAKLLIT